MFARTPGSPLRSSFSEERLLALLLCVIAALRVFIFSAGFPFFSVIDEQQHFDLIVKYSHGQIPRSLDLFSSDSAHYMAFAQSWEIMNKPEVFPNGQLPVPLWTLPVELAANELSFWKVRYARVTNVEASHGPLYYSLAAVWWQAGKLFNLEGASLLYWMRFFNALLAAAMVWLGFVAARLTFPGLTYLALSVPLLLAFIPQDAFYSMQNDALCPLGFGLTFICLLRLWQANEPDNRLAVITGLAIAATFLTKISNLPLVAVALAAVLFKASRLAKIGKLRSSARPLMILSAVALIPIAVWLIRTRLVFGDFTGTEAKIKLLGWTQKPFAQWWSHPIFTADGLWTFLSGLLAAFWRGEFTWHGQTLCSSAMDAFYALSSIALILAAIVRQFVSRRSVSDKVQRDAIWLALVSFAAGVAFLGGLSTVYDYGNCPNPSREHPYITSGRLLAGVMIPFAVLYVYGLDWIAKRLNRDAIVLVLVLAIITVTTTSEISLNRPAFGSAFNWFHADDQAMWTSLQKVPAAAPP
jgi:hypothetical protein